jgi:hypothetical protein
MAQEVYQDLESFYKPNDISFLSDWVFHYNSYSEMWAAVPRETYTEYWSNYNHPSILRSSSINTLMDLLYKTKGDASLIEKVISGKSK